MTIMSETVTTTSTSIDALAAAHAEAAPQTPAERVQSFVQGRFPQADITPDQDIFALGFINSLFAMELVMFIEKTFGATVPNDELRIDNFRTVESMAALVARLTDPAPVS